MIEILFDAVFSIIRRSFSLMSVLVYYHIRYGFEEEKSKADTIYLICLYLLVRKLETKDNYLEKWRMRSSVKIRDN